MRLVKVLVILVLCGCSKERAEPSRLFKDITQEAGIDFRNDLSFTEQLNPYTYRNFYNGAGVAIGDLNNDGLQDIYFAGNQVDNRLYINQGDLRFIDVTRRAGVACAGVWSTGVTFADINADGWLDIYVCKSGDPNAENRNNELFINNGDLTFTERAKEYGLDVTGLSVQAAFFDYDKDGDLDCYLLTNSIRSVGNYDLVKDQRQVPDAQGGGNKFFVNDDGKFRDYSGEAGIYRSNIGFGLGITLGDFNKDTWTDIFVSNDFFERDYLYINNTDGTFEESLTKYFPSISMGSMGADFADLDGDASPELFVTEMLPDSLHRKKTKTVYESWNKYELNLQNGYYHQFSRNVLQKKITDGHYAEVGRLAGVAATEWSWGALLFDMDNDGNRDIFVANGIYKDLLDRDFLTYVGSAENVRKIIREEKEPIVKLIDLMPSSRFPNYAFRNEGNLKFTNAAEAWGLAEPSFSTGSAYGDIDNDGDLDLVVNNINAPAALYANNSDKSKFASLTLSLTGSGKNTFAVGSEVIAYCKGRTFFADNFVTRGFQSSVQPRVTIGLGEGISSVDSILIRWPASGYSVLYDVPVDTILHVKNENLQVYSENPLRQIPVPRNFSVSSIQPTVFTHRGSGLVDFNRDRLLPMMYSNETPSLIKGDVNGDGVEEFYIGGGKDQAGRFVQFEKGRFTSNVSKEMEEVKLGEDTRGTLVDVDSDGDLDLYMAKGGRFFPKTSEAMIDQLFLNDGNGNFSKSRHTLPIGPISTSIVLPIDYDKDNDQDLFIGERFDPFTYGLGGRAYLLQNDGQGVFKDVTGIHASALQNIGMVTDAVATDIDNDEWMDLVIVGDWMPVVVLKNNASTFSDASASFGLENTTGWWHDIEQADLNKDGKPDFVIGNHGLNTFFKQGDRMYLADFDRNGSVEQVFCTRVLEKDYPIADKDEFLSQLPGMKKQLLYYSDYGKKSIEELFPAETLAGAKALEVKILASVLLLSGRSGYQIVQMPQEAQYSPIYALSVSDFDNDGIQDVIAGGNQYLVKPQFGRYDASHGWFFKGMLDSDNFSLASGTTLNVDGQIRDIAFTVINGTKYILFAKYDDDLEICSIPD